ncbi:hypothetical protein V1505DRAFT_368180 [Lipomyces doorenjongii]
MAEQGFHILAVNCRKPKPLPNRGSRLEFHYNMVVHRGRYKGFFQIDDAGCATVYFNSTEKNWVTSSGFALFTSFTSWERMEILIKWSGEMLFWLEAAYLLGALCCQLSRP